MIAIVFFAVMGSVIFAGGGLAIRSMAISEARQEVEEARAQRDKAISVATRWEGIANSFQATNAKNEQSLRDLIEVTHRNEQTINTLLGGAK